MCTLVTADVGCAGVEGVLRSKGAPARSECAGLEIVRVRQSVITKRKKRSGKRPVNFFPALYPVEYVRVIISDLTPNALLSCANAIVLFEPFHPVDVKIGGKKMALMRGSGQIPAALSGNGDVLIWRQDLLRKFL